MSTDDEPKKDEPKRGTITLGVMLKASVDKKKHDNEDN